MSELSGLINVLKPPGMTSHDVVGAVRRWTGIRRVGHTGTLDPFAAGVLVLCVGPATRAAQFIQASEKAYRAEMVLGVSTDSQDATGRTTAIQTDFSIPWSEVDGALAAMVGTIEQRPPMASAVHHQGRRLYELAREGIEVDRPARPVDIYEISILEVQPTDTETAGFGSRVIFDVTCGPGTYVRTLCADVGERLGCGAHCGFLVRTRVGTFRVADSVTLEELEAAARQGRFSEYLLPVETGLGHLPAVHLAQPDAARMQHGASVPWPVGTVLPADLEPGDPVRVYEGTTGRLLAIARLSGQPRGWLLPDRVFAR